MEYPTFFTTGADRLDAYPPFSWSSDIEAVTVHEFGHQYFQGMLASNEFERGWLDEGVNTYAELECMTAIAADGLVPEIRPFPYWGASASPWQCLRCRSRWARRAWDYRRRWVYYLASYAKTAVVLRTVEGLIGPEAMARGLRSYVDRHAFGHPSGRDLVAALSDAAEQDLGPFFEQAIWSDAVPDWAVTSVRQRTPQTAGGFSWDDGEWRVVEGAETGKRRRRGGRFRHLAGGRRAGAARRFCRSGRGRADVGRRRLGTAHVGGRGTLGALETRGVRSGWRRWLWIPTACGRSRPDAPTTTGATNRPTADHPLWWVREVLGFAGKIFLKWS